MTDTITTIPAAPLTVTDMRALRNADRIVFRRYQGADTVEAYLDPEHSTTGFEQAHRIPVEARVTDYGREARTDGGTGHVCFSMVHTPAFSPVWVSILGRIGKGDVIHLEWIADNNSDIIRDAGLHRDELRIRIGKPSGKVETYTVDHATGRDNSARMIRRSA